MKKYLVYWVFAAMLAVGLVLAVSDVLAQDGDPVDTNNDGCASETEIKVHWESKASRAGVTLNWQDLTDDQQKIVLVKVVAIAGSQPPYDFDKISLIVSSGGVVTLMFWKDGCALGRASIPTDVWARARETEARIAP